MTSGDTCPTYEANLFATQISLLGKDFLELAEGSHDTQLIA